MCANEHASTSVYHTKENLQKIEMSADEHVRERLPACLSGPIECVQMRMSTVENAST